MLRVIIAFALILTLLTGCGTMLPDGVIYPSITPDETISAVHTVAVSFTFERQPVEFTLTVDGGLYAGAAAADKEVIRFGNARANDWIEDYFPAFITEPHQQAFYDSLLAAFRSIRDQRGLDADRYAEMLTAYVQSITYRVDPDDLSPKFPVETFVESAGDCDDKTLLLAALLAREGYDVAVLMFEPEQHVALGIRADGITYDDTGYAYVETTVPGYIGQVPESLEGGITLESKPRVFRIDGGPAEYTAGPQVAAILDARARAVAEAEDLAGMIVEADGALAELEASVRSSYDDLQRLKATGAYTQYNAQVDGYNALVAEYNRAIQERNDLAARHNELAAIDRAVADGASDRAGTYATIGSF